MVGVGIARSVEAKEVLEHLLWRVHNMIASGVRLAGSVVEGASGPLSSPVRMTHSGDAPDEASICTCKLATREKLGRSSDDICVLVASAGEGFAGPLQDIDSGLTNL